MGGLTALQLAVPAVDALLDDLRDRTPAGTAVLDPGHISFGYPWMDPAAGRAALDHVAEVVARCNPFAVELTGPLRFAPDSSGRTTIYLAPQPEHAIRELSRQIEDVSGHRISNFTPHCSLVRLPSAVDPQPTMRTIRPRTPIIATLDRVEFHVQDTGRWTTERVLHLGRRAPWH